MSKQILKVKVQEYVETIYELPNDHFDKINKKENIEMDAWSDCEIASEFQIHGKRLFQDRSYAEDPISWNTRVLNYETNKWEEVNDESI